MNTCYLGLGSNLKTPERQLRRGISAIAKLPRVSLEGVSRIYKSPAAGVRWQPPYCNVVARIQTIYPPLKLLSYCQRIEKQCQRVRKTRWGSRTLDIDILLYGTRTIHHPRLIVPHPRMTTRLFVLEPLKELNLLLQGEINGRNRGGFSRRGRRGICDFNRRSSRQRVELSGILD